MSFIGIVLGTLLAPGLGRLVGKVLPPLGVSDPLMVWVLGPLLVFVIISAAFKAGAASLHRRVDVFYKYNAGDLRLALWERLNRRLGLCLGFLNGAAYLVLIAFIIYVGSYFTVQVSTSDKDPRWMRLLTRAGKDLHATGFAKVARSLDSVSELKYRMGDLGGMLYHNSLLQARLARYPAFLGLSERQEFQDTGADKEFNEAWQRIDPVMTLIDGERLQAIRANRDLMAAIWNTTATDLADLRKYLETGVSDKYSSERVLGRWALDANATISFTRRARPNIPSTEMQKVRVRVGEYGRATVVAMPDNKALLKNIPSGSGLQTLEGQWRKDEGKYTFVFGGKEEGGTIEAGRLVIRRDGLDLAFYHDA
jgi:hypothetical protein